MEIYLVGGAVRDQLLGLPVKERDYVVVGAAPEELINLGYFPVGKDFPVFLHPETHEEYALARTERKTGKGYKGFTFYTDPSVTLEDDLKRRDLTINAIAQKKDGSLVDPYNGVFDLKNKLLHHVSNAFSEDPVRVLRVARFSARFPDFSIHPDTLTMMKEMVKNGEIDALVTERVWQEFVRSLDTDNPEKFLEVLKHCNALPIVFPEIFAHFADSCSLLKKASKTSKQCEIRFAAMLSPLSLEEVKKFCKNLKIPNNYKDLSFLVTKFKDKLLEISSDAESILNLLEKLDAIRRPERFCAFLEVCNIISLKPPVQSIQILKNAHNIIDNLSLEPILDQNLPGTELKQIIHKFRKRAIENKIKS